MILNDVLAKQNVLNEVVIGEKMSTPTKVKVIRIRSAYSKIRQTFDEDVKNFSEQIISQELKDLAAKEERTSEEEAILNKQVNNVNSEYQEFLSQKLQEEVEVINDSFTEEEYAEILESNFGKDVEINGTVIKAEQFLEILYNLFVKC